MISLKHTMAAGLALAFLAACAPASTSVAETAAPSASAQPVISVTAEKFGDEFDANQVAAEKKYKGQRVQLTSEITNITEGRISLKATSKEISLTQISCNLSDKDQALKVTNGQKVKVTGTVDGQMMGVITLKKCVIG